ncbi:MAG: pyridoxal-phosphate dependent enzyme [Acidimicrobiales bacterium]
MSRDRVPEAWFNSAGHLGSAAEPMLLHPGTRAPTRPDDLVHMLPVAVSFQELSTDPWVEIPGPVLDVLRRWRPTPLVRATRMEAALATPARIYFKDESVSPTGSHHPTTAAPQVFYAKADGAARVVTGSETGQWGGALSSAAARFGVDATVYTGPAVSAEERIRIEMWGASAVGSEMTAVDDALRDAATRPETRFTTGSLFNHVVLHQTVIGLEAREQLARSGEDRPDVVIGYCGGGSSLAGTALPFVADDEVRLVAVEPSSWPTLTGGRFGYVAGDSAGLLPLLAMYSLGADAVPPAVLAPGLRAHGVAPLLCRLVRSGRMEAVAHPLDRVLAAGGQWARTEGPVPALGTAHALRAVIDEALMARESGEERVILFCWSGR